MNSIQELTEQILILQKENSRLREENLEMEYLEYIFDFHHRRLIVATEKWREAHPGNELTLPDLGEIWYWLMERKSKQTF